MTSDINGFLWKIGWNPFLSIVPVTFASLLFAFAIDTLFIIGVIAAGGVWYKGVQEINSHYEDVLDDFKQSVHNLGNHDSVGGEDVLHLDYASPESKSPPFVKPSSNYEHTAVLLTPSSLTINTGTIDMERKERSFDNNEFSYDNVISVDESRAGTKSYVELTLSGGNNRKFGPGREPQVEQAIQNLRKKIIN